MSERKNTKRNQNRPKVSETPYCSAKPSRTLVKPKENPTIQLFK